jgi:hypothetical protein
MGRFKTDRRRGNIMWTLIIVTFAVSDPPNLRYNPIYFSHDFSSKEKCEAAKSALQQRFVAHVEDLNRIMENKAVAGEVRDYERLHVEIICTEK